MKDTNAGVLYALSKCGLEVFDVVGVPDKIDEWRDCKHGNSITEATNEYKLQSILSVPDVTFAEWSADGKWLAHANENAEDAIVHIRDANDLLAEPRTRCLCSCGHVKLLSFSPLGTYLSVFSRPEVSKTDPNTPLPNYEIFEVATGRKVAGFAIRSFTEWPLQFSGDEKFVCRRGPNGVSVASCADVAEGLVQAFNWSSKKCEHPEITKMELSSHDSEHLATFSPSRKGQAGLVKIWRLLAESTGVSCSLVRQELVGPAQSCKFGWAKSGRMLSVQTENEVDRSGQSYYGAQQLFAIPLNNDNNNLKCLCPTGEGPLNATAWSTKGEVDLLAVSSGPMPAKLQLLDPVTGQPVLSMGQQRCNWLQWSQQGRLILAGGFGNLAGGLDVWDTQRRKLIGATKVPWTTDCRFSPDSYFILCATTSPRLRVDNRIRMLRYNGDLLFSQDFVELYAAVWRPSLNATDIPVFNNCFHGPKLALLVALEYKQQRESPQSTPGGLKAATAAAAAYRPPGSTGTPFPLGGEDGPTRQQRVMKIGGASSSATTSPKSPPRPKIVPGMDSQMIYNTSMSKKKRSHKGGKPGGANKQTDAFVIEEPTI